MILDMHEFHAMAEDPAGRKEAWLAFWRQVAPRFKDAPDDVVFELLNEPFGKLTPELWNEYLKEALAVVRATNPTRAVIVGAGHWNSIDGLQTLVAARERPQPDRDGPLLHADGVHPPGRAVGRGAEGQARASRGRAPTRSAGGSSSTSPGRSSGPWRTTARSTSASSAPTTRPTWTRGRATRPRRAGGRAPRLELGLLAVRQRLRRLRRRGTTRGSSRSGRPSCRSRPRSSRSVSPIGRPKAPP